MKVNFSASIVDLDGKPLADDLTLGSMATNALMGGFEDERALPGEDKAKRLKLALRIHGAGEVDLSAEEIALIKKLIAKAYLTLPSARAWQLLDPAPAQS